MAPRWSAECEAMDDAALLAAVRTAPAAAGPKRPRAKAR
jgi:hypothetical protein